MRYRSSSRPLPHSLGLPFYINTYIDSGPALTGRTGKESGAAGDGAGERDGARQRIDHAGRRINSSRLLTVYTAAGGERPAGQPVVGRWRKLVRSPPALLSARYIDWGAPSRGRRAQWLRLATNSALRARRRFFTVSLISSRRDWLRLLSSARVRSRPLYSLHFLPVRSKFPLRASVVALSLGPGEFSHGDARFARCA